METTYTDPNRCEKCGLPKNLIGGTIMLCSCDETPPGIFGSKGWVCPVCGAGNSPFTSQCPCITQFPKNTY